MIAKITMNGRDKAKRFAIRTALILGIFTGLLGFVITYNEIQNKGYKIPLSFLAGLLYFGTVFGAITGVHKIVAWVSLGFYGDKIINIREGCRRLAVVSTVVIAISCGLFGGTIPFSEYQTAKNDLRIFRSEPKEYEGKAYYDYAQRLRIEDNYWLNLPKGQLAALCIIGGLAGAAIGSCAVWFGYRYFEQLVINFYKGRNRL